MVLYALLVGIGSGYMPAPPHKPGEVDLRWFWDSLKEAKRLDVLEGLPHPMWEKEEREQEARSHPTQSVNGELFYAQALDMEAKLKDRITTAFLEENPFVPPKIGELVAMKLCGGFHADYGLQWSDDKQIIATALVCFGCHEIRLVGHNTALVVDMTESGHARLAALLKPLRVLRPPFRHREQTKQFQKLVPTPEMPRKIDIPIKP